MSAYKLVNVRHRKRSIGKSCIHCSRPATVTAVRVRIEGGMRLPLNLCENHYELVDAAISATREVDAEAVRYEAKRRLARGNVGRAKRSPR